MKELDKDEYIERGGLYVDDGCIWYEGVRYLPERTCHPMSMIEYRGPDLKEVEVWACSVCGNIISWDYDDYDPDTDGPSYCDDCRAKVVGPKVVEE